MKSEIYNAHAALNRGFDFALESLKILEQHGVLTATYVHDHAVMIEELKAGINRKIHETLGATELRDWTRLGKLRHQIEVHRNGQPVHPNPPRPKPKPRQPKEK